MNQGIKHFDFILQRSWTEVLGICFCVLLTLRILVKIFPRLDPIEDFRFHVVGLLFLSKCIVEAWQGFARSRQGMRKNLPLSQILFEFVPPPLVSTCRFHYSLCWGFFQWLQRKKHVADSPGHTSIDFMKKSEYGTALVMLFLMLFVEVPISTLVFGAIIEDPIERHWAHVLVGVLSAYTLMLVLGDRWKIKAQHHSLDNEFLYLRCADRFKGDIPLTQIKRVEVFRDEFVKWKFKTNQAKETYQLVSPIGAIDKPNILIELVDSPSVSVWRNFLKTSAPKYLLLFVDDAPSTKLIISEALNSAKQISATYDAFDEVTSQAGASA